MPHQMKLMRHAVSKSKRTVYVVRDAVNRKFLNCRTYTGTHSDIWGRGVDAYVFQNKQVAQSCASNINARRGGRNIAARVIRMTVER